MCTSIGDIFNSVNKCENGAPYCPARYQKKKKKFDLCEGGSRIADLESGRVRDVHASTVNPTYM